MKKYLFGALLTLTQVSYANVGTPEEIQGYIPGISEMYVRVYSGGCTEKKDFVFEVQEIESRKLITFYRMRPDYCRSFLPNGKTLVFSLRELGLKSGDHYNITNSIRDSVVW